MFIDPSDTEALLARELGEHGTVRMPYVVLPGVAPDSIGWRMGIGEAHLEVLRSWAATSTVDQRADAVRAGGPLPAAWARWAARFITAAEDGVSRSEAPALLAERRIRVKRRPKA